MRACLFRLLVFPIPTFLSRPYRRAARTRLGLTYLRLPPLEVESIAVALFLPQTTPTPLAPKFKLALTCSLFTTYFRMNTDDSGPCNTPGESVSLEFNAPVISAFHLLREGGEVENNKVTTIYFHGVILRLSGRVPMLCFSSPVHALFESQSFLLIQVQFGLYANRAEHPIPPPRAARKTGLRRRRNRPSVRDTTFVCSSNNSLSSHTLHNNVT